MGLLLSREGRKVAEQDYQTEGLLKPPPQAWAWTWLIAALLPALLAVTWFPHFVTQDGPAHAASSQILVESLQATPSSRSELYDIRLSPLPNWTGHLALSGLIAAGVSPRDADRLVMILTLTALAAAILWLRLQVADTRGGLTCALLAGLLAMNVMWLFGFYSFLMGAALYAITLAQWWRDRDRPGLYGSTLIAGLLVAGYFAHLVSLGLTAFGLLVLALATPGPRDLKRRRLLWTAASLLPLLPLAVLYLRLMRQGGGLSPTWPILQDPTSLQCWWQQLGWIDPISLGSKLAAPFSTTFASRHFVFSPALWLALGLGGLAIATLRATRSSTAAAQEGISFFQERRAFLLIAGTLLLVGLIGPDSLGATHGNYLAQRQVLLGLVSALPLLNLRPRCRLSAFSRCALLAAVAFQGAFVVDYALRSERVVANLLAIRPFLGTGQRIGLVALELKQPFRANPLRHADCLLGLENSAIVWGNYEMAHYYFPVQIRREVAHPPVLAFEQISLMDDPRQSADRARSLEALLEAHHDQIDALVVWGQSASLPQVASQWYAPAGNRGKATVFHRKNARNSSRLADRAATKAAAPSAR